MRYVGKPPYSKNSADYQVAADMLKTIRPYVTLFSSSGYINDLAGGSLCLSLGWNAISQYRVARAKEAAKNGNNIVLLVPSTGAVLFFDYGDLADAAHPENAHKFINYILRPGSKCRADQQGVLCQRCSIQCQSSSRPKSLRTKLFS